MDNTPPETHIHEWDESDVHSWLASIGYPQYEAQIREHKISGDVLCALDAEALKAVGVTTIGQRLAILKAIYLVKVAHAVPIEPEDYIPPSEVPERGENVTLDSLNGLIKDLTQRINYLEDDNRNLKDTLSSYTEEFNNLRSSLVRSDDNISSPLHRQPSFQWANYRPQAKLDQAVESPRPSPQQLEHDIPPLGRNGGSSQLSTVTNAASGSSFDKLRPPPVSVTDANGESQPRPQRQESSENLNKSFKVTLDDPTWKVLPAALKKYRINNDSWQNYAMFICYGSPGNRIERCLSYDEKPLLLFQKLKDAKKNPVFMLKHIKDIRSPIAVAQQKHAARKASSVISNDSTATNATPGHAAKSPATSRSMNRPPRLEVQDLSTPAALSSSLSPQPGWPDQSILSPAVEGNARADELSVPGSAAPTPGPQQISAHHLSGTTLGASPEPSLKSRSSEINDQPPSASMSARDVPVPSGGISYAVAIYPYMAEHEDEFDVVVGDTFIILSRARGWWVVQRDPTGSGIVETDTAKQGWVPAGCLLETNVPVASAIAEATAAKGGSSSGSPPHSPISKTPILPLSIISTSFPGIALMDYKKKGDEELDLVKDDALRVFKRYNHWSYAVKEEGGDRGWVPSWFIGKVAPSGGNAPMTPSTSLPAHLNTSSDDNQAQISPMSSAFPAVQTKS